MVTVSAKILKKIARKRQFCFVNGLNKNAICFDYREMQFRIALYYATWKFRKISTNYQL